MVWNPSLVFYACVAKGSAVLAEYVSAGQCDSGEIAVVARRCIQRTPQRHSSFSHTVRQRSYTFLIDAPIAFFAISHEELGVSESLRFLERVKSGFNAVLCVSESDDTHTDLCLQEKMSPLFSGLLRLNPVNVHKKNESSAVPRMREKTRLLLPPAGMILISKKGRFFGDGINEARGGTDPSVEKRSIFVQELPVSTMHNGGDVETIKEEPYFSGAKQKMRVWRTHVWVVLALDLVVCAVLLGIWLGVCEGFKCIDG